MKTIKSVIAISLIISVSFGLSSCKKEQLTNSAKAKTIANRNVRKSKGQSQLYGVSMYYDIVKFQDEQTLSDDIEILSQQVDENIDQFNGKNLYVTATDIDNMTEEELLTLNEKLDAIAAEEGYSEFAPNEKFESEFNFNSLRQILNAQEEIWLKSNPTDLTQNPQNSIIGGTTMKTFFNQHKEIMIGDVIYKFLSDNTLIEIVDGDYQTVLDIRNNEQGYANKSNVKASNNKNKSSCDIKLRGNKDDNFFSSRMLSYIKCQLWSNSIGTIIWTGAETTQYVKSGSRFKIAKANIKVTFNANRYFKYNDCTPTGIYNDYTKDRYASHVEVTFGHYFGLAPFRYGYKTDSVSSSHVGQASTGTLVLH